MTITETAPVATAARGDGLITDPGASAAGAPTHGAAISSASGAPVRVMAIALWGVVGSLLAYGVLQTALKAAVLFA